MNPARALYNTLRWRLIPVRQFGKLARNLSTRPTPVRLTSDAANDARPSPRAAELSEAGFAKGPIIDSAALSKMQAIYGPRGKEVVPRPGGHPFVNLFRDEDIDPKNPVFQFAVSPEVLDVAHDYFGGKFLSDSIQVLYSWPTGGALSESQFWHKDYGDSHAFHCVAYLNDVLTPADGPFVFADKHDSARIGSSLLIRRIDDATFEDELAGGEVRSFYGRAGESVLVDPSQCYHYGSRCETPRLAVFATFSTDRPYVAPQPIIRRNRVRAASAAAIVRPDLSAAYLERVFGA